MVNTYVWQETSSGCALRFLLQHSMSATSSQVTVFLAEPGASQESLLVSSFILNFYTVKGNYTTCPKSFLATTMCHFSLKGLFTSDSSDRLTVSAQTCRKLFVSDRLLPPVHEELNKSREKNSEPVDGQLSAWPLTAPLMTQQEKLKGVTNHHCV